TDGEHARVAVDSGERLRLLQAGDRRLAELDAEMAVRVDQPGHKEPAIHHGLGTRHRLRAHPIADQPELPYLVFGKQDPSHAQRHARTLDPSMHAATSAAPPKIIMSVVGAGWRLLALVPFLLHQLAEVELGWHESGLTGQLVSHTRRKEAGWHLGHPRHPRLTRTAGTLAALALVLRRLGGLATADARQPHHAAHLFHHLLGLGEPGEELVDLHHRHPRSRRDPGPPRPID